MHELDSIIGNQKHGGPVKPIEKFKGFTQFSKMLIFINFHPVSENKPWIYQEYMDSLKKRDIDTPRLNRIAYEASPAFKEK